MKAFKLLFFLILVINQIAFSQNGWFQQASNTSQNLNKVKFVNASTGFVIGDSNKILRTSDSGVNWISSNLPQSGIQLRSIHFINESTGWIGGGQFQKFLFHTGVIYQTTNAGLNWISIGGGDCTSIYFINENTGFRSLDLSNNFGSLGNISKTTDGGLKWFLQNPVPNKFITNGMVFLNAMTGWSCRYSWSDVSIGDSSIVSKTTDGGDTWIEQLKVSTPFGYHFKEILYYNNILWVTGDNNVIYKSENEGENWIYDTISTGRFYKSLFFINSNTGWLCGSRSYDTSSFLKTTDGGNSWISIRSQNTPYLLNSVHFANELTGWSVGVNGVICKTTTGGITSVNADQYQSTESYHLKQNYPNPFNPNTIISYSIQNTQNIKLNVYDITGNEVAVLVDEKQIAGSYSVEFEGLNLSSGVYFYKLSAGNFSKMMKMILLK